MDSNFGWFGLHQALSGTLEIYWILLMFNETTEA